MHVYKHNICYQNQIMYINISLLTYYMSIYLLCSIHIHVALSNPTPTPTAAPIGFYYEVTGASLGDVNTM